jgi:hypothetical protein
LKHQLSWEDLPSCWLVQQNIKDKDTMTKESKKTEGKRKEDKSQKTEQEKQHREL